MSVVFRDDWLTVHHGDAATAEEATARAKAQANDEGWTVRTLTSCRQQPNGDWVVTLAVYAAGKAAAG